MKTFTLFIFSFFLFATSKAQTPQFINYQAVARYTNTNIPIPYQNVVINFKIRQGSPEGLIIFDETQNTTTDNCGLFNVKIGDVNKTGFTKIDWSTGNKFLAVTINDKVSGATELVSVPYSLYAAHTLNADKALTADKAGKADTAMFSNISKSSLDWKNVGDTILYSANKNIGIGTSTPLTPLQIKGEGNLMRMEGSTHCYMELYPTGPDTRKGWIGYGSGLSATLSIDNDAGHIVLLPGGTGNVGIGTSTPQTKLDVAGVLTTTGLNINGSGSLNCLTIKGGCDWYEEAAAKEEIEPGYVVAIDANGAPNSVLLSAHAYDRMIAGVVSGAGGIHPGIGLQQNGVLEGNTKVAMGGKINVHIVGKVKPGDLLTSSNVAGCAMAAKNRRKSFGAVLGKALSVPNRDGLVLMQVMME